MIYRIMKNTMKRIAMGMVGTLVAVGACKEPFDADPIPAASASSYAANFIFANASDVASLDFHINNVATTDPSAYLNSKIPSNGAIANVNLRAKASSGTVGGVLGSNDVIFRSSNNGTNNFTASDSAYYTVIALDTATRPAPLRTLNAGNFGDTTFFNPLTGKQLSVVDRKVLSSTEKAQLITIGTVPLGSSDPGGPRFLIITDQLPLPSVTRLPKPATGKASVRFVNAVGDAPNVAVTFGTVTVGGSNAYPMLFPAFSPSVGSRSLASAAFTTVNSGNTDITVKYSGTTIAQALAKPLADGGVYTFFLSGSRKKGTAVVSFIKNK